MANTVDDWRLSELAALRDMLDAYNSKWKPFSYEKYLQ